MAMVLAGGDLKGKIWLTGKDLKGDDLHIEIDNNKFTVIGKDYRRSDMPMDIFMIYLKQREELSVEMLTL